MAVSGLPGCTNAFATPRRSSSAASLAPAGRGGVGGEERCGGRDGVAGQRCAARPTHPALVRRELLDQALGDSGATSAWPPTSDVDGSSAGGGRVHPAKGAGQHHVAGAAGCEAGSGAGRWAWHVAPLVGRSLLSPRGTLLQPSSAAPHPEATSVASWATIWSTYRRPAPKADTATKARGLKPGAMNSSAPGGAESKGGEVCEGRAESEGDTRGRARCACSRRGVWFSVALWAAALPAYPCRRG